ncbi:LamB/YcsF family protein [Ornithinimicrobium flavum]|uniref:LamB/YcsF family protein n=1 Tax=Ornithinimicrobium flavum TaxID=1288636 RepID=UPI00106FF349|nr:5-oxoprolinase subunit PxpA [Ornithinimicrobium flavum]
MRIDLNADLGESFGTWVLGDDAAMLDVVTSANVATGFHAGDPGTLLRTVGHAARRGVAVGAQVGYRDLGGFGRRFVDVDPEELEAEVLYQLGALDGLARVMGTRVTYVKPHGALYHAVAHHERQARALVRAMHDWGRTHGDRSMPLLHQAGSLAHRVAQGEGIPVVTEAFADRGYRPDGRLVPRGEPGALLEDPHEVAERLVRLAVEGVVTAVDGTEVEVRAESICVHGDTPGAVGMARQVRAALEREGIELASFAPPPVAGEPGGSSPAAAPRESSPPVAGGPG